MSVLRSSLLGSLLQVLKFNVDRKARRIRLFEVGRVFLRDASVKSSDTTVEGFAQPMRLAGMVCGSAQALQWGSQEQTVDFFDVKGDIEALLAPRTARFESAIHPAMHPGRCARVVLDGVAIGFVGELHPQWRQAYDLTQTPVMFELELDALLQRKVPSFQPVAKQQAVERDIAVLVDEKVTYTALTQAVWSAPTSGLLRDITLFDIYRPKPGNDAQAATSGNLAKSVALRLTLNSEEVTLSEDQIESTVQAVLAALVNKLGARQRT